MIKLLLPLLLLIGSSAVAQKADLDKMITKTNQMGLFKGNVLVIDKGREVYRKAIGLSGAKGDALTSQYRFHIGSIAKEFNAVSILLLQEQGKLKLDDKISKYLPELPQWASSISIMNILQYASGVPDLPFKNIRGSAAAMDSLKRIQKLDFSPGTQYAYNNSNTLLQRKIVERISGMTFNKFLYQHILKPLGMNNAVIDPDENTGLVAISYNDKGENSSMQVPIEGWTALTLDDFLKWERSLEQFKLISPASTQILLTPFAQGKQCGLGGGAMSAGNLIIHTHDGTAMNYQALLTADTQKGRVVILLTNNKQNNLYDINSAIQNILDGKSYAQPKKQVMTALQDLIGKASGQQLLDAYLKLRMDFPDDYGFDQESALNVIGYTLLNKQQVDAAIILFEYNTKLFPQSGNVFDSLGEAYLKKGDKANAVKAYKKAFELDPANETARRYAGG